MLEDLRELRPRLERQVDAIEVRERLGVERLDARTYLYVSSALAMSPSSSSKMRARRLPIVRWTLGSVVRAEDVGVRVGEGLPAAVDDAREALRPPRPSSRRAGTP